MLPAGFSLAGFLYTPAQNLDLTWLYLPLVTGSLLLLVSGITIYILRLNRRLAASEQQFRLLAENAFDVIWTMDLQGHFTYVSPSVQRLLGYTPAEVMQQSLDAVLPPASLHLAQEGLAHVLRTRQVCQHHWELELCCKEGSTVWTDIMINPLRYQQGAVAGLLGIIRDITEQRRTREALHSRAVAIEAAAETVIITDATGLIEYVNPAFTHMTGYTAAEVTGQKASILKSHVHGKAFYAMLWDTIQRGEVWRGETVNCRKDGSLYTQAIAIAPVLDDQGRLRRFVSIMHDITAQKQQHAAMIAERIRDILAQPFHLPEGECVIGASIGISLYPRDASDPESLSTMRI